MPPEPLFDLSTIDTNKVAVCRDDIYKVNPHAFEFRQLDGIYFCDHESGIIAGYRDVRDDEFWVRGHIPGRPIFPGVLMIEASAQLVGYFVMTKEPNKGFLGFGAVDDVKFRGEVVPGQRLLIIGKMLSMHTRRNIGATQAYADGKLVYEGTITGMWL